MTIPNDLRAPFVYVEFDPSKAVQGPGILRYKVLLIGGRLSTGTRAELIVDKITSESQAESLYGIGSQLANQFKAFFANNKLSDVYGCSLDDAATGVLATGTFVIAGTATADGTLVAYVAGKRYSVAVSSGDAATAVGAALAALITADTKALVTAANVTGTVTTTSRNKGEACNNIDIRINYNAGEELPAGITCTVNGAGTQGIHASGANNPLLSDVIAVLGDEWYNIISSPYTDVTNVAAIEAELASRFGPTQMLDGVYMSSIPGSVGTLTSYGNARNSPHSSFIHAEKIPGWSGEVASAYAGQVAAEGQTDPARPFQTLPLSGILPPAIEERFTLTENNTLLWDGISTFQVDSGGVVRIQRAITTYQTNVAGSVDTAYLDMTTMLTLMFLRFDFRNQILTRYPRAKLADDGVQIGPGQVVMTPKLAKAEAVSIARGWEQLGLVENIDEFKENVSAIRNISDPNRMDWTLPPDLMNQFRVGGATIQFLL